MAMNPFPNLKRTFVRESLCGCRDELWGCSCPAAASVSASSLGESQEEWNPGPLISPRSQAR